MYPLNMDNFRWGKENDSPHKEFARKLWTKAYDYNIKQYAKIWCNNKTH